jgi:anti-sigma regulatory factor (Ser/Thr protein kinase)
VLEPRAFAATLEAAAEAEAWAASEAERLGLSADESFSLTLGLEELFVNAVRHGGARRVRLAIDRAGLDFRDDGAAFDPTRPAAKRLEGPGADFEPGGFGLALLQRFAGRLRHRREDGWNIVTLAFGGA